LGIFGITRRKWEASPHYVLLIKEQLNYPIYNKKLLAIIEAVREKRPYLSGTIYEVQVYTDYENLWYFRLLQGAEWTLDSIGKIPFRIQH
jgi:hypothetical protein